MEKILGFFSTVRPGILLDGFVELVLDPLVRQLHGVRSHVRDRHDRLLYLRVVDDLRDRIDGVHFLRGRKEAICQDRNDGQGKEDRKRLDRKFYGVSTTFVQYHERHATRHKTDDRDGGEDNGSRVETVDPV